MNSPICHQNQTVGTLACQAVQGGVRIVANCTLQTTAVLRVAGMLDDGTPLVLGVLEPCAQGLTCTRLLTDGWLRERGCNGVQAMPQRYLLQGEMEALVHTGDALLDALIDQHAVTCTQHANGKTVQAPFDCHQPNRLAFCLTACRVEEGKGELRIENGE